MITYTNWTPLSPITITNHLTRLVLSKGSGEEGYVGMYGIGELAAGPEGGVLTTRLTNGKDA